MAGVPTLSLTPATDAELIPRILGGDRAALEEIFQRHRTVAYRVAYRLLGHEADALDAVQEAFTKALTHLKSFRGGSSFKTWLLRIVSNAALDLGRQRRRNQSFYVKSGPDESLDSPDDLPAPDAGLERLDLRQRLNEALAALPEHQRRTFVLHVDGDLSYQEVADALGISIGTVMSRIFYARKRLQEFLADYVCP
jgi:RNA polymerase sigma-70 factor (ECF subfamily)